jgi:hypothetical protein
MAAKRNRNMCVKIAKDVLQQLRLGRYIATQGTYVQVVTPEDGCLDPDFTNIDMSQSFQKFFKQNKEATCDVCALGSAFVSLVNIENKCSVEDIQDTNKLFDRLVKYFGNENIALMESAFEVRNMNSNTDDIDYEMLVAAAEWGNRYDDPTVRLRAIMLNVIRNRGDFKLPKKMLAAVAARVAREGKNNW